MKLLLLLLFFVAAPFWETKAARDWGDDELLKMMTDSPWAQMAPGPATNASPMQVMLATAEPIVQAEAERERRYRLRHPKPGDEPGDLLVQEYRDWLKENRATQIVLAIGVGQSDAFSSGEESKRMEEECTMQIGRKKYKMTGHFPPSAGDPYLRLAFPRVATEKDKAVIFDLYVPGISLGARSAEFKVKDMMLKGKLEM